MDMCQWDRMAADKLNIFRVPYPDFNALKLPPGTDHEKDFITLADIFPLDGTELFSVGFNRRDYGRLGCWTGILFGSYKN